jgi:hypothetical protein
LAGFPFDVGSMNNAERLVIWFLAGGLATAAIAWVAFQVQQDGVAPAVLFPLLVGAAVGGVVAASGQLARLPGRRAAVVVAVCWGLLAVVAQDYVGHRYRMRRYDDELVRQHPLAAVAAEDADLRPTFADYLAGKLETQGAWWMADLLLTAAAAGVACALGMRIGRDPQTASPGEGRPVEGNLK